MGRFYTEKGIKKAFYSTLSTGRPAPGTYLTAGISGGSLSYRYLVRARIFADLKEKKAPKRQPPMHSPLLD